MPTGDVPPPPPPPVRSSSKTSRRKTVEVPHVVHVTILGLAGITVDRSSSAATSPSIANDPASKHAAGDNPASTKKTSAPPPENMRAVAAFSRNASIRGTSLLSKPLSPSPNEDYVLTTTPSDENLDKATTTTVRRRGKKKGKSSKQRSLRKSLTGSPRRNKSKKGEEAATAEQAASGGTTKTTGAAADEMSATTQGTGSGTAVTAATGTSMAPPSRYIAVWPTDMATGEQGSAVSFECNLHKSGNGGNAKDKANKGGGNSPDFDDGLDGDNRSISTVTSSMYAPKSFEVTIALANDAETGGGEGTVALPFGVATLSVSGEECLHGTSRQMDLPVLSLAQARPLGEGGAGKKGLGGYPLIAIAPSRKKKEGAGEESNKNNSRQCESNVSPPTLNESRSLDAGAGKKSSGKKGYVHRLFGRRRNKSFDIRSDSSVQTENTSTSDRKNKKTEAGEQAIPSSNSSVTTETTASSRHEPRLPTPEERAAFAQMYSIDPNGDAILRVSVEVYEKNSDAEKMFLIRHRQARERRAAAVLERRKKKMAAAAAKASGRAKNKEDTAHKKGDSQTQLTVMSDEKNPREDPSRSSATPSEVTLAVTNTTTAKSPRSVMEALTETPARPNKATPEASESSPTASRRGSTSGKDSVKTPDPSTDTPDVALAFDEDETDSDDDDDGDDSDGEYTDNDDDDESTQDSYGTRETYSTYGTGEYTDEGTLDTRDSTLGTRETLDDGDEDGTINTRSTFETLDTRDTRDTTGTRSTRDTRGTMSTTYTRESDAGGSTVDSRGTATTVPSTIASVNSDDDEYTLSFVKKDDTGSWTERASRSLWSRFRTRNRGALVCADDGDDLFPMKRVRFQCGEDTTEVLYDEDDGGTDDLIVEEDIVDDDLTVQAGVQGVMKVLYSCGETPIRTSTKRTRRRNRRHRLTASTYDDENDDEDSLAENDQDGGASQRVTTQKLGAVHEDETRELQAFEKVEVGKEDVEGVAFQDGDESSGKKIDRALKAADRERRAAKQQQQPPKRVGSIPTVKSNVRSIVLPVPEDEKQRVQRTPSATAAVLSSRDGSPKGVADLEVHVDNEAATQPSRKSGQSRSAVRSSARQHESKPALEDEMALSHEKRKPLHSSTRVGVSQPTQRREPQQQQSPSMVRTMVDVLTCRASHSGQAEQEIELKYQVSYVDDTEPEVPPVILPSESHEISIGELTENTHEEFISANQRQLALVKARRNIWSGGEGGRNRKRAMMPVAFGGDGMCTSKPIATLGSERSVVSMDAAVVPIPPATSLMDSPEAIQDQIMEENYFQEYDEFSIEPVGVKEDPSIVSIVEEEQGEGEQQQEEEQNNEDDNDNNNDKEEEEKFGSVKLPPGVGPGILKVLGSGPIVPFNFDDDLTYETEEMTDRYEVDRHAISH